MPIQRKKIEISPCEGEVKSKNIKIEILSIRLEYDGNLSPMRSSAKPFDFFDRCTQIDRESVTWYFSKIKADLSDEGQKSLFSLPHWCIKVNNPKLFNFMNKSYNCIDLIFGQEKTYYKFSLSTIYGQNSNELKCIEGETELDVGTCSCCIDTQFPRIIESLRKQLL